jgi:hypothetical protein
VRTPGSVSPRIGVALLLCSIGLASCSREVVVVARELSSDAPSESLTRPGADAGSTPDPVVAEPVLNDASAVEPPPDAATREEPGTDDEEPRRDFDDD